MKMKAGFSLEETTIERITQMARATRRNKGTIVEMAIELLAQQDEFSVIDIEAPARRPRTRQPSEIPGVRKGTRPSEN